MSDTAASYGQSFPQAAATPFVLGLAEVTCHEVVADTLAPGEVTVGVRAVVEHFAPTPVGLTLTAVARLRERDGRRLHFDVDVRDDNGPVARVEHERAVVRSEQIANRLESARAD